MKKKNYSHFMVTKLGSYKISGGIGERDLLPLPPQARWCNIIEEDPLTASSYYKEGWETDLLPKCFECRSQLEKYGYKEVS